MNRSVKTAAVLSWCYAASLAYELIGVGLAEGRVDKEHFVRHLLGALLWVVLGWALLRGRRWAWYIVVYVWGTLGLLAVAGMLYVLLLPGPERHSVIGGVEKTLRVGKPGPPLFVLSVAVLVGIVVSLLRREARNAFFPRSRQR